jgi:hypothetical protein
MELAGRANRANGVVFVADGHAEQRHQPVAARGAQRACVLLDGLEGRLPDLRHEDLDARGLETLDEIVVSAKVGDEDRPVLSRYLGGGIRGREPRGDEMAAPMAGVRPGIGVTATRARWPRPLRVPSRLDPIGPGSHEATQRDRKLGGGAVALLGPLGQQALDDEHEAPRQSRPQRQDRLRLALDDGRQRLRRSRPREGPLPGHHLVKDGAERELVGARVHGPAGGLLRRHVPDGPEDGARPRRLVIERFHARIRGGRRHQLRQTEVEDLHQAVIAHHHVLGLEVPVHDPGAVGPGQAVGQLCRHLDGLSGRGAAGPQAIPQGPALDELHHQVATEIESADIVDRHDVGVVEGRGGACFALEAGEPFGVRRPVAAEHLDRHRAAEPQVAGTVDLPHAARAHERDQLVGCDPRPGSELQTWGSSCGLMGPTLDSSPSWHRGAVPAYS